jgi:hypothetical protein
VCKSRGMIASSNKGLVSVTCCSGIRDPFCFEEGNSLYSIDRGLGKPRIESGRFGKEKILVYLL